MWTVVARFKTIYLYIVADIGLTCWIVKEHLYDIWINLFIQQENRPQIDSLDIRNHQLLILSQAKLIVVGILPAASRQIFIKLCVTYYS